MPDGVRRKKKAQARKQSGKPPGFDEQWVLWEGLRHREFGQDVLLHNGCESGLWCSNLGGRSVLHSEPKARRSGDVDPFSAQLELAVMGQPVQFIGFRPARDPPERLLT